MITRNNIPDDEELSEGLQALWETHQTTLTALRDTSNECNETASKYSHMIEDLSSTADDLDDIKSLYLAASEVEMEARIAYFGARRAWLIACGDDK